MPNRVEECMALFEQGKVEEARAILKKEIENAKFAPDTVSAVKGKAPRFTKKGKAVELGEDGKWRRKLRSAPK